MPVFVWFLWDCIAIRSTTLIAMLPIRYSVPGQAYGLFYFFGKLCGSYYLDGEKCWSTLISYGWSWQKLATIKGCPEISPCCLLPPFTSNFICLVPFVGAKLEWTQCVVEWQVVFSRVAFTGVSSQCCCCWLYTYISDMVKMFWSHVFGMGWMH